MISSQKCVNLTNFKKNCSIESWFFSYEERYTYYESKIAKKVYVTVLLFILYSIWVHVESLKYKMICRKTPKSSEFAMFLTNSCEKSLNMFISSCLNNCWILKIWKLLKIKSYASGGIQTCNPWVLRLYGTLAQ